MMTYLDCLLVTRTVVVCCVLFKNPYPLDGSAVILLHFAPLLHDKNLRQEEVNSRGYVNMTKTSL